MALALGILMGFAPPVIRFRKPVVFLSAGFLIFGLASFLPAGIFGIPGWRENLKGLGVETGDLVAIQSKQALEYHLSFLLLFLSGLWILGQRFSASATRNLALTFVLAVAAYALVSKLLETQIDLNHGKLKFGFFPNRNHTSNLLSAGFLCGLGIVFQSVRNKNFYRLAASSVAAGGILWAGLSWNLSRSGIALCLAGPLLWLVLLPCVLAWCLLLPAGMFKRACISLLPVLPSPTPFTARGSISKLPRKGTPCRNPASDGALGRR